MDRVPWQEDLLPGFSALFYNSAAVKEELKAVQEIVLKEPENSVLVLSTFKDTQIGADLMSDLNRASERTKDHVRKTAVLGVTGFKRTLGDMLTSYRTVAEVFRIRGRSQKLAGAGLTTTKNHVHSSLNARECCFIRSSIEKFIIQGTKSKITNQKNGGTIAACVFKKGRKCSR